jgi:hypothetical protein
VFPGMLLIGLRCRFLADLPVELVSPSNASATYKKPYRREEVKSPLDQNSKSVNYESGISNSLGDLHVEVVQAKDVFAVDKSPSSSDPYVKITIGSKIMKTKHILKVRLKIYKNFDLQIFAEFKSCLERSFSLFKAYMEFQDFSRVI